MYVNKTLTLKKRIQVSFPFLTKNLVRISLELEDEKAHVVYRHVRLTTESENGQSWPFIPEILVSDVKCKNGK